MLSIVDNQKTKEAIKAGLAFRQAYNYSKNYKACLWGLTFLLAAAQLLVVIISKYQTKINYIENLDFLPVAILIVYVLINSFGKDKMKRWHDKGCEIQSLHDSIALGVTSKTRDLAIPQSEINNLYESRKKKHPDDVNTFATWWDSSLNDISFFESRIVCAYVTFFWEVELRKKYQRFLSLILIIIMIISLIVISYYNFPLREALIFIIAPITPFISLLIEELYDNNKCIDVAEDIKKDSCHDWQNVYDNKFNEAEINESFEKLMSRWHVYRLTTLPIFEWLYKLTQKSMNMNMVADTDSLVEKLKSRSN